MSTQVAACSVDIDTECKMCFVHVIIVSDNVPHFGNPPSGGPKLTERLYDTRPTSG